MSATLSVHPDALHAATACATRIFALLEEATASVKPATLAISGGSTPKLMFEVMAQRRFAWDKVHLFWVDERAVPPDDPQSNYKLAYETLIAPARIPAGNVHRVRAELPPEEAAREYTADIRSHFGVEGDTLPHFDIVHQGLGPDCHTASLFPGEPLIENRDGIAAAVYVEKMRQSRITLLPGVLLAARATLILAAGSDKTAAAETVLQGPYDPSRYPAQVISRGDHPTEWFLDEAAAGRLRR